MGLNALKETPKKGERGNSTPPVLAKVKLSDDGMTLTAEWRFEEIKEEQVGRSSKARAPFFNLQMPDIEGVRINGEGPFVISGGGRTAWLSR